MFVVCRRDRFGGGGLCKEVEEFFVFWRGVDCALAGVGFLFPFHVFLEGCEFNHCTGRAAWKLELEVGGYKTFRVCEDMSVESFMESDERIHRFELCIRSRPNTGFIPTKVRSLKQQIVYRS